MSTSLHWRPAPAIPPAIGEAYELKHPLTERYGLGYNEPHRLDKGDLAYLEGLRDGGVTDADDLIKDIRKYGSVEVWVGE